MSHSLHLSAISGIGKSPLRFAERPFFKRIPSRNFDWKLPQDKCATDVIFTNFSHSLYHPLAKEISLAYGTDGAAACSMSSLGASVYHAAQNLALKARRTKLIPLLLNPSCLRATMISPAFTFSGEILSFG